jgi:DNA repair protein RadC
LRDRFTNGEEGSRSDESLLELLLTYAIPQKDVRPLAKGLLSEYGDLSSLLGTPMEVLCRHSGIKENSAALLKLVDWIRRHHHPERSGKKETSSLKKETPSPAQGVLPGFTSAEIEPRPAEAVQPRHKKPAPRRGTGMFSNAALSEAIQLLPRFPDSESLSDIRSFLRANLHFNAAQTRQRYASYIVRRMFPEGYADAPLTSFAKAFPDTQELKDVCFYRFLLSEPLEVEIVETLLLPNIGMGSLHRSILRRYLAEKFPASKSAGGCGKAAVDALTESGAAKADRTKITFAYRDIPVASFAFVLHSEFPEPGMYDLQKLEENRVIRAMLWNPDRLLQALYELRNRGLISKISEIDSIRQFTIKYSLVELVERLVSGRTIS